MNERAVLAGPNFSAQFKSACDEKGFYSKFESFYCRRVMSRLLSFSSGCPKSIRLLTTISSPFFYFSVPSGPPLDLRCQGVSPDTVSVEWSKPRREERNGIIRGYSVRYYPRALCYGEFA